MVHLCPQINLIFRLIGSSSSTLYPSTPGASSAGALHNRLLLSRLDVVAVPVA
jgi:hypothetical protein